MPDNLAGKTVEALRRLAHDLGLSGYSRMRKAELVRLLQAENVTVPAAPARTGARQKTAAAPRTAGKPAAHPPAPSTPAAAHPSPSTSNGGAREQQIESSKYALTSPAHGRYEQSFTPDLAESLDYLPTPVEPVACLLPQKPGVLHAYWSLTAPLPAAPGELRLRLGRLAGDGVEIIEEIPLPSLHGHWYFHVPESLSGDFYLHLGAYRDGRFVTAIRRGIARVPRLFAPDAVDRLWWIDEERFREMYLRAGGVVRRGRLAWPGAAGSPGGAGDSTVFSRR
jgi:hypothetical protein